jgi:hypothetical protein
MDSEANVSSGVVTGGKARAALTVALRFVVVIALAFWMGGFTFYAGVVIHVGHRVFGSARETGFLTQQVTVWLNRSGAIVLGILVLNLLMTPRLVARDWWMAAAVTVAAMIGLQIALFQLHGRLDLFLDAAAQTIRDRGGFRKEHLVYMNVATTQWAAALLHLMALLALWRRNDGNRGARL